MEYEVLLVTKDQGHILSKYVVGDENQFVVGEDGSLALAADFFAIHGDMKFRVILEE